jgi:lysozyme family protein
MADSSLYPDQPADKRAAKFTDDGRSRLFNLYRERLRHWEGGTVNDARGGRTKDGMSQNALEALNEREKKAGSGSPLPSEVDGLTPAQITGIFRREYFDRLRIEDLASLGGMSHQAPALPEQMFDIGIHAGIGTAARYLQKGLNNVLPKVSDPSDNGKEQDPVEVDGVLGSKTIAAVDEALRLGKGQELNDAIVKMRTDDLKAKEGSNNFRGWFERVPSFSSGNYRIPPW